MGKLVSSLPKFGGLPLAFWCKNRNENVDKTAFSFAVDRTINIAQQWTVAFLSAQKCLVPILIYKHTYRVVNVAT